ncbi:MAG: hypothetical protein CMO81_03740 [Waddliaceae bacterium]|nr:hypothetical protein [Waddliaceae bacterium]
MWREIASVFETNEKIAVTTHVNPDGDGIGAACALADYLIRQGKQVRFICDSFLPEKFHFLDTHAVFEVYASTVDYSDIQVLVTLDAHRKGRIGQVAKILDNPGIVSVCIDHHPETEGFSDYQVIDPYACSVGAMIYDFLDFQDFPLNHKSAQGIYTSIVTDTSRFCNSSTDDKAHRIAEHCLAVGVDTDDMFSRIYRQLPLEQVSIFATVLSRMESFFNGKVILQELRQEDLLHQARKISPIDLELDYFHDFNKWIHGIDGAVVLQELSNNEVRISLRSSANLDASQVMACLGGGGHRRAAGATVNASLKEAKIAVLKAMGEAFDEVSLELSVSS